MLGMMACLAALAIPACGPGVDLEQDLEVTDVFSGWYDYGVVEGGLNKLVPSISFRLQNNGQAELDYLQVMVSFWQQGADAELDTQMLQGIDSDGIPPGEQSEPILARSEVGYTIAQPRAELFTHSQFVDFTAKIFARSSGNIVPIGEFTIDRRIIPQSPLENQ